MRSKSTAFFFVSFVFSGKPFIMPIMAEKEHLPKEVTPEPDKSHQAGHSLAAERRSDNPSTRARKPEDDFDPTAPPTAPYGDPKMSPDEIPLASHPDPEVDPYVTHDAAQPIGTGRLDQALAEADAGLREDSPELEDESNRRIHGRHHEKFGGRPLESGPPAQRMIHPKQPLAGLNHPVPHTFTSEEPREEGKK
jgi:hypothetical protein